MHELSTCTTRQALLGVIWRRESAMTNKTIIRSNIDALRWTLAEEQSPTKRQQIYRLLAEERAKLTALETDRPAGTKRKKNKETR